MYFRKLDFKKLALLVAVVIIRIWEGQGQKCVLVFAEAEPTVTQWEVTGSKRNQWQQEATYCKVVVFAVLVCFVKVSLLLVNLLADDTSSKANWYVKHSQTCCQAEKKAVWECGMQLLSGSLGIYSMLSLWTISFDEVFEHRGKNLTGKLIQNKLNFWHVKLRKIAQVTLSSWKLHISIFTIFFWSEWEFEAQYDRADESSVLLLIPPLIPDS